MTPERYYQVRAAVAQAQELGPAQRGAFLDELRASDPSLFEEVDSWLGAAQEMRDSFLRTRPVIPQGTRLGDFEIDSLIGSGGMGEVYRARDLRLPRNVAIKLISSYLSHDQKQIRRFEQEAHAAAALNHPNILVIFQSGTHQGIPYLVTEFLEGETLRHRLRQGRLPLSLVIDLATQTASGLAAAHQKGIVHRDVKPENLYITKDGGAKILDFGLAKLTQEFKGLLPGKNGNNEDSILLSDEGMVMGTVGYMSPEQARGQPVDARSDIFCFGAVLYEMVTGKAAFRRENDADSISSILNEQPPAISRSVKSAPAELQRVIHRCLEKQPERRYQQTSELVVALKTLPKERRVSLPKMAAMALALVLLVIGVLERNKISKWIAPNPPEDNKELLERNLTANPSDNPVRAAALTRDGKYVAYTDNSAKINQLLVDSGDARPLSLDSSYVPLAWLPDGVHLLVASGHGPRALWKFSTFDSSLRKLWDGEAFYPTVVVSPDGSSVAFAKDDIQNEIWVMGAGGEEPHKLAVFDPQDSIWGIAWSPNGKRLGYIRVRGTYEKHDAVIETCDLHGADRTPVLSNPNLMGRDGVSPLAWLADGRIVYAVSTALDESNLWAIGTSGDGRSANGNAKPITAWKGFVASSFQITEDGKHMIALKSHSDSAVYLGALGKAEHAFSPKRLTADNWRNVGTAWTADSRNILLYSQRNGSYAIRRQPIDGSMPETLIEGQENYRDPIVSSSGTLLYTAYSTIHGLVDSKSWRLMSTPFTGGPRQVLLSGRYSYGCGSAPSSPCTLAFLQPDHQFVLYKLDPVKGKGAEIARIPNYADRNPHWWVSHQGTQAAIADADPKSDAVRILNVLDGKITSWPIHKLETQAVRSVSWAADDKQLVAILYSDIAADLVSVDSSGTPTVLYEVPSERDVTAPLSSPDGRFLAFSQRILISDLVLLESF